MRNAPKPWHFEQNRDEVTVCADNDWPIARMVEPNDKQFASLIVRAVNSYDDMLVTLRHCLDHCEREGGPDVALIIDDNSGHMLNVEMIRAAIAKGEDFS